MSCMNFTIRDADRAIHCQLHGSYVDTLIPALSDDPETIDELRHAIQRFRPTAETDDLFQGWRAGDCDEPYDAGVCIIDLAARLIVHQSTYSAILRYGEVTFEEGDPRAARWIRYHLTDEWQLTDQLDGWQELARERRAQRQAQPLCDTRSVLYGKVAEFIVSECFAAREGSVDATGTWIPPTGWEWRELPGRAATGKPLQVYDAIAEIHARWLMTKRPDLNGRTPHEVLHAERAHLEVHLEDREHQWSVFNEPPQPLWRESIAFRYGGYGNHEIVIYYDLLRHLIAECWKLMVQRRSASNSLSEYDVIDRLQALQQGWLQTPGEDFGEKTPAYVIERERLRLPLGANGEEAMIDCDCPLCQMMADSGPVFWHIDGCNMDEEFPFSLFETTLEEWEREHERFEEWRQSCDALATAATGSITEPSRIDESARGEESSMVWKTSLVRSHPTDAVPVLLFGLGARLAELIQDLRHAGGAQSWIDTLNRDFGNLRATAGNGAGAVIGGVVSKFSEDLFNASEAWPAFSEKCLDLERQLVDFAHRAQGNLPEPDAPPPGAA